MFTLTKQSDAWYLMKPHDSTDTEEYKFHIVNCVMFVKVISLSAPIYESLKSRLQKEKILFHYRKLAMKTEVLNAHSILFESQNLFPDSSKPLKVYFALVRNSSTGSNYKTNPFCFLRSLTIRAPPKPVPPGPGLSNLQQEFLRQQALAFAQQQETQQMLLEEIRRLKHTPHHSSKHRHKHQKDSRKPKCRCPKCRKGKAVKGKQLAKCSQIDGNDELPKEADPPVPSGSGKQQKGPKTCKKSGPKGKSKSTPRLTQCETRLAAIKAAENVKKNCAILNPPNPLDHQTAGERNDSDYSPNDEDHESNESSTESEPSESSSDEFDTAEGEDLQSSPSNTKTKKIPLPVPPVPTFLGFWPTTEVQGDNDKVCFVESFELDVDSKRCDAFSVPATLTQAPEDYLRFLGKCTVFFVLVAKCLKKKGEKDC